MLRFSQLTILAVIFVCTVTFLPMAQAAKSEARVQLEATINDVLHELEKPGLKNPAERPSILANVEKIIQRMFDFRELSSRTVGPKWKSFTPDQQQRFIDALTDLLRETYLEKLEGYNGEVVNYLGEEVNEAGDRVRIQTSVKIKDKDVPVLYSMMQKDKWVVYDVTIEGVSMVKNYRTQFQELLVKGDIEALINQVKVKAEEVRKHNKTQQTGQ